MPYQSKADLPPAIKKLPPHAQDIYMGAFNAAFKQYNGDEEKSHATAWAAVKHKYSKGTDGQWHRKESDMRKLIQDTTQSRVEIIESKSEADGTVRHRARFLVSRADEVNGNNRLYPLTIWQREAGLVNEGKKVVAGQSGHPEGATDPLKNFLRWDAFEFKDKDLLGEADIIPTTQGRDFIEVARAMPEIISVSTRGMGTSKKEKRGDKDVTVIQDDYELVGIDVIFKGEQSFKDGSMLQFEMKEPEPVADADHMMAPDDMPDDDPMKKKKKKKPDGEPDADADMPHEDAPAQAETSVTLSLTADNMIQGTTLVVDQNPYIVQLEKAMVLAEQTQKKLEERITFAEDDKATLQVENKTLKDQLAAESEAHNETKTKLQASDATIAELANGRAVRDHIVKRVEGEKFAVPLLASLWECKTVAEVDSLFPREKARLETELSRIPALYRAIFAPENEAAQVEQKQEPRRQTVVERPGRTV